MGESGSVDGGEPSLGGVSDTRRPRRSVGPCSAGRPLGGPPVRVDFTDGVPGDPWTGRLHASTSPTGGRPATPLRLGDYEGGSDEQCPAPDQADGDVAALPTCMGCGGLFVARASEGVRGGVGWIRRGSRRADVGSRFFTIDLHDDRPFLGVRELVTDLDRAVLVLVDGVAVDQDRSCPP